MLKTLWFFQSLLKSSRFLPIFVAQFCGALNDNLYKSAMLILVAFQLTNAASDASTINNLAALLFILPFFLAQFPNCMHGLLIAAARQARGDALPTMPMRWNHLR